jgi:dolichol-phosphate mannosyltransferase
MLDKASMTLGVALSVVVPAHDEALNLARLVQEVRQALDPLGLAWELIVADDGSTDDTPALLVRLAADEPRLRSTRLPERRGQTAALAAGFRMARGPLVATLDADLQCPPAELPKLMAALDGAAMASGIRSKRHDPPSRRAASALANLVRRSFLAWRIRDLACPIRVFRADALARVETRFPFFDGAHRWLPALFHLAGERVVQRPVVHRPREAGVSKYTTRGRLLPIARELVRLLSQTPRGRWAGAIVLLTLAVLPFLYALGHWPRLGLVRLYTDHHGVFFRTAG